MLAHSFFQLAEFKLQAAQTVTAKNLEDAIRLFHETEDERNGPRLECWICSDTYFLVNGVRCGSSGSKHFMCDSCFEAQVESNAADDLGDLKKRNAKV